MHLRERLIWSARGQRFNRLMRFGRPPILGLHSRVEHDRPCLRCEALQAFPPPALDIRSVTSRASNSTATATGEEPSKLLSLHWFAWMHSHWEAALDRLRSIRAWQSIKRKMQSTLARVRQMKADMDGR